MKDKMENVGIVDVARYWFKHYPSDIFTSGPVAEIRCQFALIMKVRHVNRMHNLRQNTKNHAK